VENVTVIQERPDRQLLHHGQSRADPQGLYWHIEHL